MPSTAYLRRLSRDAGGHVIPAPQKFSTSRCHDCRSRPSALQSRVDDWTLTRMTTSLRMLLPALTRTYWPLALSLQLSFNRTPGARDDRRYETAKSLEISSDAFGKYGHRDLHRTLTADLISIFSSRVTFGSSATTRKGACCYFFLLFSISCNACKLQWRGRLPRPITAAESITSRRAERVRLVIDGGIGIDCMQ